MMKSGGAQEKKFVRITSGVFREDFFSAQHDYGRENFPWKDFEIFFALSYEKKSTTSLYLLFFVKENSILFYFDGGSVNYRALLKNEYTGRGDTDFTLLIQKFQTFVSVSAFDETIKDFLNGGSAFLPAFTTMPKIAEYAEAVKIRSKASAPDRSRPEEQNIDEFLNEGSRKWDTGEVVEGRFKVIKFLQGGMGVVYIVTDIKENKLFAMKTFQDKYLWNRKIIRMFVREAEVWVRIGRHKNIVTAEFVKNIDGKPYIFLEFIDGDDLRTILKKEPLDTVVALDFAIQFCSGMLYANEKLGIVHRDVKPSNCMITSDGILKITDFGLVLIFQERTEEEIKGTAEQIRGDVSITRTGAFKGTLPYMAPERFKNVESEIQSDVYSFGVMLYEMLTARLPIMGESMDEFMTRHIDEVPAAPSELNRRVPAALSRVVMTCLEKEPAKRYKNFRELRDVLMPIYERIAGATYVIEEVREEASVEELLTEGNSLEALEKYREALQCYDRALKIDNKSARGWHGKARIHSYLGQSQSAIRSYEAAIHLAPKEPLVWYDKGNLHFQLNDHIEALRCYETALALDSRLAEVWNKKGLLLDMSDKSQDAIACYDEALKINPKLADAWNNKGNLLYKKRHYKSAERCYDEALKINPRKTLIWYNKGNISSILNNLRDALDFYQKALDIDPAYIQAWTGKGLVHMRLNEMNDALGCFSSALEVDNKSLNLLNLKAGVLYNLGLYEDALQCHEKILAIDDKNLRTLSGISQVLIKIYAYDRAFEHIGKAMALEPENKINRELANDIRRLIEYRKMALMPLRRSAKALLENKVLSNFSLIYSPADNDRKDKASFWGRFMKKGGASTKVDPEEIYRSAKELYDEKEFEDALLAIEKFLQGEPRNQDAWKLAGLILKEMGQRERAMECRLKALDIDEKSSAYWNLRGEILEEGGEYFEALQCYQLAIVLEPENLRAMINSIFSMEELGFYSISRYQALDLLNILSKKMDRSRPELLHVKIIVMASLLLGRLKEGMKYAELAMSLEKHEISLYFLKGMVLSALGRTQDEIQVYSEAMKIDPGDPDVAISRGIAVERDYRIQEAQRYYDMVIEKSPDNVKAWYHKGVLYMHLRDYEGSLKCFNRVLEINPESVRGWIIKGIHMKQNQKEQDALWAFNKAAELNIHHADAHMNRGLMLISMGRYSEASNCFEKITELDSEHLEGWLLMGISNQKQREYEKSIECCMRALKINPRSTETMVTLGCTYSLLGRYKEAHSWIGKALRVDNRSSIAWMNRGILLTYENNRAEALQSLDKALEINPESATCWYNKGVLVARDGHIEDSLKCFDKALLINKKNSAAWLNRGCVQLTLQKPDEALKCFDKALEADPKDPRVLSRRGIVYIIVENYQEALKSFNRALRYDPAYPEALINKGITLLYLDRRSDAQECFQEAKKNSEEFARAVDSGSFSLDTPLGPELPQMIFGPFVEGNPEFEVYEKQENFMKKEYVKELFTE